MNEVLINSNVYNGAASYAKLANVSVSDIVEKAIMLFLQKAQTKQKFTETTEFKEALAYVKTMKAKGGKPVPADEDGLDALVEKKYAL